jgi:hypothetical protein
VPSLLNLFLGSFAFGPTPYFLPTLKCSALTITFYRDTPRQDFDVGESQVDKMNTPSPLAALSSPSSFYTANASHSHLEELTTASSPAVQPPSPFYDARQLPRELRDHCQIYLEEQLCTFATGLGLT